MKKETQVHMLPTKDATNICKSMIGLQYTESMKSVVKEFTNQHLYFTNNEDIEPFEKCWVLDSDESKIFFNGRSENTKGLTHTNFYHKIIATTNTHLHHEQAYRKGIQMPNIPQSFIEKYVKENGIDKIEIEYVQIGVYDFTPALTKNNEIIVHSFKPKIYTKEVVESLCKKAWQVGFNVGSHDDDQPSHLSAEDWIKKNL